MDELGIKCEIVNVPDSKPERKKLLEVSKQAGVPTIVTDEGQIIADDDDAIIAYLNEHYGK
jgi:glutathione S-transferase